jgi:hypothetical protein
MTKDIAGFVGDLDLAKVDLEIIKKLFPESYDEVAASKRGALRTVSLVGAYLGDLVTSGWYRELHSS